jgi:hypothetical protein
MLIILYKEIIISNVVHRLKNSEPEPQEPRLETVEPEP